MVIGIDGNRDRHQIGISDRHRWNTQLRRGAIGNDSMTCNAVERMALVVLACLLSVSAAPAATVYDIHLNSTVRYQTMNGWEAALLGTVIDYFPYVNNMDPILDLVVNEMGVTRVRLEVVSGAENPVN